MHTKANAAERLRVGEPSSGMSQALRSIRRAATQPSGGIAAVWVLNNVYKMEVGRVESEECAPSLLMPAAASAFRPVSVEPEAASRVYVRGCRGMVSV
jgi:hypothetical protein